MTRSNSKFWITSVVNGICATDPEAGQNRGFVIETVKNYLQANKDQLDLPAYVIVSKALMEAFPCE